MTKQEIYIGAKVQHFLFEHIRGEIIDIDETHVRIMMGTHAGEPITKWSRIEWLKPLESEIENRKETKNILQFVV